MAASPRLSSSKPDAKRQGRAASTKRLVEKRIVADAPDGSIVRFGGTTREVGTWGVLNSRRNQRYVLSQWWPERRLSLKPWEVVEVLLHTAPQGGKR